MWLWAVGLESVDTGYVAGRTSTLLCSDSELVHKLNSGRMTSLFCNTGTVGEESPMSLSGLYSSKPSTSGSVRSSISSGITDLVDDCQDLPDLSPWLDALAQQSGAAKGTIMVALVYVERIQSTLPRGVVRLPSTAYRLLLAGLIVAAKMTHDCSLRNSVWAKYSDIFDTDDVNLMEAQLLQLID